MVAGRNMKTPFAPVHRLLEPGAVAQHRRQPLRALHGSAPAAAVSSASTRAQAKASAYEKALAIQDHLSGNFHYSLDIPVNSQERPLEEFLFSRKTGYCEHYATAMVVMLRSVTEPSVGAILCR